MHILIAPNAFKSSLSATEVAHAIQLGLGQSKLTCTTECFPVGDGGDGTAELLLQRLGGQVISASAHDPLGRPIASSFVLIDSNKTAVIEMANASGMRLLQATELNPLRASSFGTGELFRVALDMGIENIIVCVGGTATVDGGCGILRALGFQFMNDKGKEIENIPGLVHLHQIDLSAVDGRVSKTGVTVLCDVENMLLGSQGAAAVFGPQKGATVNDVPVLEAGLSKLREVVLRQSGNDMATMEYGGAAGGTAAGLAALLNAKLVNGIDYFLSITNFEAALAKADLVITGEGSLDIQTLRGKGPFGVAKKSKDKRIPVVALAGSVPMEKTGNLERYFDAMLSVQPKPLTLAEALVFTKKNIIRTAKTVGDLLALH